MTAPTPSEPIVHEPDSRPDAGGAAADGAANAGPLAGDGDTTPVYYKEESVDVDAASREAGVRPPSAAPGSAAPGAVPPRAD